MAKVNTPQIDVPVSELEFRFKGHSLSLNFVATVGERWRRNIERLRSPGDLDRWCRDAGFGAPKRGCNEAELGRARELREAIHRSARAAIEAKRLPAEDRRLINDWARCPDVPMQLIGLAEARREPPNLVDEVLAAVARDVVGLLGGGEATRIRVCGAPHCSTMFVDRSRGGERQWCSKSCADRVNAHRYRRRRDSSPDPTFKG